jgi:hypothetical protein
LHTQAAFPQRNEIGRSRENANFVAIFREQTAVISAAAAPGIANLIAQPWRKKIPMARQGG